MLYDIYDSYVKYSGRESSITLQVKKKKHMQIQKHLQIEKTSFMFWQHTQILKHANVVEGPLRSLTADFKMEVAGFTSF